ncbi:MAG: hypothetical protein ACYSSO_10120 [Planctomycetota bacterium]|jgi:DNA-directed RNA polymerase specialized sigma subunit
MSQKKSTQPDIKESWKSDIELIKILLILLVNKLGLGQKDIAKAMGISEGRLSQILNPNKYKKK